MSINSAKYIKDEFDQNVTITADFSGEIFIVPLDPANRHYAAILEWVAEGKHNTGG
jgi:hypothetical protein